LSFVLFVGCVEHFMTFYIPELWMYFAIIPIKFGIIVITFIYKSLKDNNFVD
jgi:hypothetical protein